MAKKKKIEKKCNMETRWRRREFRWADGKYKIAVFLVSNLKICIKGQNSNLQCRNMTGTILNKL